MNTKIPDKNFISKIIAYRGKPDNPPEFVDQEKDSFFTLCDISAPSQEIPHVLCDGPEGQYYRWGYEVILSFGLTELRAQLAWWDDGKEHRSPATIIYDDDFTIVMSKD